MRVHLLSNSQAEILRAGQEPNCEDHGHLSLGAALAAERREEITFIQGLKYAVRQRSGIQVITAHRNEVGETGMVHSERR